MMMMEVPKILKLNVIRTGNHIRLIIIVVVLLAISNIVLLYRGTYSSTDYELKRPPSLALKLYKDNDLLNPRFQRARSWLVTERYDDQLSAELNENFKSFQVFDPRLATSIWLDMIVENLQDSPELLPLDFKLPFNWGMIMDLRNQLLNHPYYENIIKRKLSCTEFGSLDPTIAQKFRGSKLSTCVDYDYENPNFVNPLQLPFKLTGKDNLYLEDLDMRKLYSIMYCITGLPTPSKILFLGAIDNLSLKKSLVIPLEHENMVGNFSNSDQHSTSQLNPILRKYSNQYIDRQMLKENTKLNDVLRNGLSTFNGLHNLNQFILNSQNPHSIISQTNLHQTYKKPTVIGVGQVQLENDQRPLVNLSMDLFNWDVEHELEVVENEIAADQSPIDSTTNASLLHIERLLIEKRDHLISREPRYWGLASSKADKLDHFDFRFFRYNVKKENPDLHAAVLHRLTRAWFKLCHEFDVPTWLNHGPLIGWYWNGLNLNYDADIDVQLPIQSLLKLAKLINDTLIYDFINEKEYINDHWKLDNNAELGLRSFYFEVADSFVSRTNALSPYNNIDARLIDTQTGVYIDITALLNLVSHTQGSEPSQVLILNRMRHKQVSRFILSKFYDQFYDGITLKDEIHDEEGDKTWKKIVNKSKNMLNEYLQDFTKNKEDLQNYIHDRNYHFYNLDELNPLIPTYHENYDTFIPSNFLKNLIVEYGDKQVILRPYYQRYKFFSDFKLWVSHNDCPVYDIGEGSLVFRMNEQMMTEKCLENPKIMEEVDRLGAVLEFHVEELNTLLGGGSRDELILNKLMKNETQLDYSLHLLFILNHLNHILRPEPFLVENFS